MTANDILHLPARACGLGFGAMRLPSDKDTCRTMFDAYLDAGFNYFDTAYVYANSEVMLKKALVPYHPRDSFLLADKLPPWMTRNHEHCDKLLHDSLKRCGVDYFDFYLIHSLDTGNEKRAVSSGVYEWAAAQKEKGLCSHVGFSFHGSAALLDHMLTIHPEMEFVQLQLNYLDVLRGQAGELHQVALKHRKPIIVMEPVKGGTLAQLPPAAEALLKGYNAQRSVASWALRYAATLPGVTCVLSGMSSLDQVRDNLDTFTTLEPLTQEENAVIEEVLRELSKISTVPCTACRYCMTDCPQQIEIPVCFSLYNEAKRGGELWNRQSLYGAIEKGHRANDCAACGICLSHCPQHIDIPKELAAVAALLK